MSINILLVSTLTSVQLNIYFLYRNKKYINKLNITAFMKKGRPVKSEIRQNVVEILHFIKKAYGYEIYKVYTAIFPKVTLRSIYYHLKKGVDLGEFVVNKIEREKGDYSWGGEAEKIYYALGPNAKPTGNDRVREYVESKGKQG